MYKKGVIISLLLVVILFVAGCSLDQVRGKNVAYQSVTLLTEDNVTLSARYYPSPSDRGLVMVHMMGRDKSTYDDFAAELMPYYKVITFDLRGHGDSDMEYLDLTDKDFTDMHYDVKAAADALVGQGVNETKISLVGASVGANLALQYAETNPVDKLVLISPGLRYRSVDISRSTFDDPVLIMVGHYDAYASISVDDLTLVLQQARVMKYNSAGHGTDLLTYTSNGDLSAYEDFFFYLT